jgi:hypothetical protein
VNSVYTINGKPISKTISQKDLGVLTTPTLKWDLHTLHMCSKAQKMLGFLHRTSDPCFSIEARRCLYLSLVRSNLGYASEVWSALSGKNLRMVEGIQRRATKFILGYHNPYQPYKDRLLALKLLPVCYWHEIKDLVFFFKIINGFYKVDISNLIQPNILLKSSRNRPKIYSVFLFSSVPTPGIDNERSLTVQ